MKSSGLVSVVIPTKNRKIRLFKTLSTILNQTYQDIEVVISDDGSTDGTEDAILELGDDRIRVVRSEVSQGVSLARNSGIEASKGHWVAVCDDDDFWVSTKLEYQVNAMQKNSSRWSFAPTLRITDDLKVLFVNNGPKKPIANEILAGNLIPGGCSSVVVQKDLLVKSGMFDEQFSMFADWDLWSRLSQIEEPVSSESFGTLYVIHEGQMITDQSKSMDELDKYRIKFHDEISHNLEMFEEMGVAPVDRFIATQLFKSGGLRGFGKCVSHLFSSGSAFKPSAKFVIGMAAPEWIRKRRFKLQNKKTPEVLSAVEDVRKVIG